MRTDFLGLEAYVCVAEVGSFRKAAEVLNLTQTAVSHRIRKLEESINVQLFVRDKKEVRLTDAGSKMLPKTRELLHGIQNHLHEIKFPSQVLRDKLAIGCLPMIAMTLLPKAIRLFEEVHKNVTVVIHDIAPQQIEHSIRNGSLEFGITNMAANHWDMEVQEMFTENYSVICPIGHPFTKLSAVNWSSLKDEPLIRIGPRSGYHRLMLLQALGEQALALQWKHEVLHINSAIGLVAAGVALSVAPLQVDQILFENHIKVMPLEGPTVSRRIGIVSKRDTQKSRYARDFCEILKDCASWR